MCIKITWLTQAKGREAARPLMEPVKCHVMYWKLVSYEGPPSSCVHVVWIRIDGLFDMTTLKDMVRGLELLACASSYSAAI
jgi:hypothetical protein